MNRMVDDKYIKTVKSVIDDEGNIDASKLNRKLYYHPILIQASIDGPVDVGFAISLTIINNDPTPFTFETFIKWAEDLSEIVNNVLINASGFYKDQSYEITSLCYLICVGSDKSWRLRGGVYNSINTVNIPLTKAQFASLPVVSFEDSVNEIYPNIG